MKRSVPINVEFQTTRVQLEHFLSHVRAFSPAFKGAAASIEEAPKKQDIAVLFALTGRAPRRRRRGV